jgi:anti-sigma factor ChrR (cupin superfamily)
MQMVPHNHASEDVLEQYAMGTMSEANSAPLEEHLLVCPACCERVAWLDDFVKSICAAAEATPRVVSAGHHS